MLALACSCLVAVQVQSVPPAPEVATISRGAFAVGVDPSGLIVVPPPEGLATVDGPLAELQPGDPEWFGVSFTGASGPVQGVAAGLASDWARRMPVRQLSFEATGDRAVARTALGELRIVHELSFDPDGPHLIVEVRLKNTGSTPIRDLFYTREWLRVGSEGWSFPSDFSLPLSPPADVARRVWMLDDLAPGASGGVTFSVTPCGSGEPQRLGNELPLVLWTTPAHPAGIDFGETNGISWGDYDADGYPDVFAARSRKLWRNVGGTDWVLAAITTDFLPINAVRYGASFGDYDADGLNDLGTEPRRNSGDNFVHLGRNLGGGHFDDIANDPALLDLQPGNCDAETWCWGDVDGDGQLDAFIPTYPAWAFGGPGNFFLYNRGPVGPGGQHAFFERSAAAGLDNPPGTARPEGAQFVDVDSDGDLDLYCNGTSYRNRSIPGQPVFEVVTPAACGVTLAGQLEEGALFCDYDRDGDLDLICVYSTSPGVRIWESRGDGTYFPAPAGTVESPLIGLDLGISVEDWDNDGDLDLTTRQVFRRNQLSETGVAQYSVALHDIPGQHISSATPAWADWDKDGDLDCALGNWLATGHFYLNTLYDASTPQEARRYVRVHPARWSVAQGRVLETEYGTTVEVRMRDPQEVLRRIRFTSSSGGYLNQNEYALHFALPDDPYPNDPGRDVEFDVIADFPVAAESGAWRVDRFVNPLLGSVALASLVSREIRVFRAGEVVIDGVSYGPSAVSPQLVAAAGGLAQVPTNATLPLPSPAPNGATWVSLAFETATGSGPTHVVAIELDGELASGTTCSDPRFALALWDVTDLRRPVRVSAAQGTTSNFNSRTRIPFEISLPPGRQWRLCAHVASSRATTIAGPVDHGRLRVLGGAMFTDMEPCNGAAAASTPIDPTRIRLSVSFHR